MIFSETGRSRHRSRRHSRLRRRTINGISALSGLVVLSLAVLSLAMTLMSGDDTSPGYVYKPAQLEKLKPAHKKEQHILNETLDKLAALKTTAVEEDYDICDAVPVYSETDDETIIVDEELDETAPSDSGPGEEILAQKPADQPEKKHVPFRPSAQTQPGFAPNSASPFGQPFPQLAAAPRKRVGGSPFGGPSAPPIITFSPPPATPDRGPLSPPLVNEYTPSPETPAPDRGPVSPPIVTEYTPPPETPAPDRGPVSPPLVTEYTPPPETPEPDRGPVSTPDDNPNNILDELDGPLIGDASDPTDGWYSPGHSPGIATVAGDFNLDGQTILFEILGTEAGLEYDQLQVEGIANLNEGNVVFAFINGFIADAADLFDLILASEVLVDLEKVNFYYGLFDPANEPSYDLHGPHNLSLYTMLDYKDSVADDVTLYETGNGSASINSNGLLAFDQLMRINYLERGGPKESGPDVNFNPVDFDDQGPSVAALNNGTVPEPGPLLLLASGLLLLRRFRKGR